MYSESGSLPRDGVGLVVHPRDRGPRASARRRRPQSYRDLQARLPGLMRTVDWLGVVAIGLLADLPFVPWNDARPLAHSLGVVLGATATVNLLHLANGYCLSSVMRLPVQLAKVTIAWGASFAALIAIGVAINRPEEFVGLWAVLWLVAAWLFLVAARCIARATISRWRTQGRLLRNVAILGAGPAALVLADRLRRGDEEANVMGVFLDAPVSPDDQGVSGDSDTLAVLADVGKVDEIILALPWSSPAALNRAIAKFAAAQVEVKIDPGISEIEFPPQEFGLIAGIPTLTVQRRPLSGWGAPVKRVEDVVCAAVLLILISPLLAAIAILIKLDSRGPVLFRQERYGFNNNRIMVCKFRSMRHDPAPDPAVPQARRNDPRVTRVGALLRRTSLDELPQLFNVLRGTMSLVGPRPHASAHNEKYVKLIDGYLGRHRMKPGITGWAQVNGWRGETETIEQMRRRLEHDLFYIANWSLLLDVKVCLMTIPVVARGTNAY
jgi:putative colanic acid biosynthesis UDP-glucose lipid carrier transferase